MTYKQNETYGTTIGGCFSSCATVLILGYVSIIMGAFFFMEPNFGQTTNELLLPLSDPPVYTVAPQNVIPAFAALYTNEDGTQTPNDPDMWKFSFSVVEGNDLSIDGEYVAAIDCREYF